MQHTGRSLLQEQSAAACAHGNSTNKFLQLRQKAVAKLAQRDNVNASSSSSSHMMTNRTQTIIPSGKSQPQIYQNQSNMSNNNNSSSSSHTAWRGDDSSGPAVLDDLVSCRGCSRRFARASLPQHEKRCSKVASIRDPQEDFGESMTSAAQLRHRANAAPIPSFEDMPAASQATRMQASREQQQQQSKKQQQYRDPSVNHQPEPPITRGLSPQASSLVDAVDTRVARAAHTPNFASEVEDHGIPAQARVERAACRFCQRQFAVDRLSKHMTICQQSIESEKKRQVADLRAKRVEGLYADNHAAEDAYTAVKKLEDEEKMGSSTGSKSSSGKWRMESAQFQRAMKGIAEPPVDDDRVPCPHCGRKFSDHAAQRHIPRCTSKSKAPR